MRRRILLADDSVTIQKVIELTFLDEDYEVKAVSNGDEAIAALPQVNPDFVIADVHMPGANGYEVCRRSKELRPDIPVLLLVGTFEPFDEGQSRAVGADSFLKKPFDSQELLQRVEDLLASKAAAAPPAAAAPESDLPAMPSLSELPPFPAPVESSAPAADWTSFEVESPPAAFTLEEDRPFALDEERPFGSPGESSFDETPFLLEEEPLTGGALPIDESSLMPAGEPLFDLDSPSEEPPPVAAPAFETFQESHSWFPSPSIEPPPLPSETVRVDTRTFQTSGFATTPEERLGVPQGAVPLVESREETEARIEAPPPPSIEASHEPASTLSVPAPVMAAPVGALAVGAATPANGHLTDEDVDRIARRVVELMADKAIRDVAWEVIPDMAEMVIRDRLRELESQAESFE
jgi:CheY-like chemotaxis protein